MSSPLPTRENASSLVRTDPDVASLGHHDLETAPRAQPTIAGPVGFTPPTRTKHSTSYLPYKEIDEQLPQLSERKSVSTTQYLTSDKNATTPRLSPTTTGGKNDHDQDVLRDFELPSSFVPQAGEATLLPRSGQPAPPIISPSTLTNRLLRSKSDYAKASQRSTDKTSHDSRRRDQELKVNEALLSTRDIQRPSPAAPDRQRPTKARSQTGYTLRMSTAWAPSEVGNRIPQATTDRSGHQREERSEGCKRRTSSNRGHNNEEIEQQEQQIEATLANQDPLPNVRSRKASHYLGIFKENTSSQDHKKHKDRPKDTSGTRWTTNPEPGIGAEQPELDAPLEDSVEDFEIAQEPLNVDGASEDTKWLHSVETRLPLSRQDSRRNASQPLLEYSDGARTSAHSLASRLADDEKSIEWRSERPPRGTLPLRLLEEIRNHGSLSTSDRQHPGKKLETPSDKAPSEARGVRGEQGARVERECVLHGEQCMPGTEDDEESESDKEHIASATYYPHQAPSSEILSNHHDLSEEGSIILERGQPEPQTLAFDDVERDVIHESRDSALALQSKSKVHYISTNYQTTQHPHEPADFKLFSGSSTSSASDTDYDSSDDAARIDGEYGSGVTDDGGLTPTATPHTRHYFHSHPSRTPLGAVELKPYKHQVGGHSKVFSFSKQAICKQLNNRENEFYEVIERRHPELLRFLPK